uniref:Uncharacterized protein n=1 Tax=Arundo donax TaxID=35708 RepID=A0A0A9A5Q4_ARUDO
MVSNSSEGRQGIVSISHERFQHVGLSELKVDAAELVVLLHG